MTDFNSPTRHIVVMGMMGIGKSSTAGAIAERLGLPTRDSDVDVERLTGQTGAELAEAGRVDDLHALEEAVLLGALALSEPHVISAAGWTIESALCRDAMARRSAPVWLDLPLDQLHQRIATGSHRRSIAEAELAAIQSRRRPHWQSLAQITLDAARPIDELVAEVSASLPNPPDSRG